MNGSMPEITATELKQRLDNGDDLQIIDVREANELEIAKIPGTVHIPLGQILNRMSEIDANRETVVHCKMGGHATIAARNGRLSASWLTVGNYSWSNDVDRRTV
jgi:adenylyltransferase/sulfurtransferase